MKNNKFLVVIAIILMNVLAVYMVFTQVAPEKTDVYSQKIEEARTFAEKELCQRSVNAYNEALAIKESVEIYIEMIDAYDKGVDIGELGTSHSNFTEFAKLTEKYPNDVRIYERVCDFHVKYGKIEECIELLVRAKGNKVESEKLTAMFEEMRYAYKKVYTMYNEVSSIYDNTYLAEKDGMYAILNNDGSAMISGYSYLSGFNEGYAFARIGSVENTFRSFVIDKTGTRQFYLEGVEESSGVGPGDDKNGNHILLLAGKKGDTYSYYDMNGEVAFGEYLFAGRFRNNVAAVMEAEGKWRLINAAGEYIVDTVFEDIILNEFDECAAKGLIWAKTDGKYSLYDGTGKKISDFACDGAKAFMNDIAAFKSGELWGFVNDKGEVVIEPQYDDANSFANGLAGVSTSGIWKFINLENKVVIDGYFEDARFMASNGICFVKSNGRWSYLEMYYVGE